MENNVRWMENDVRWMENDVRWMENDVHLGVWFILQLTWVTAMDRK